jgi:hypothetical protein
VNTKKDIKTHILKEQKRLELEESQTWGFDELVIAIAKKKIDIGRIDEEWRKSSNFYRGKIEINQKELNKLNRIFKMKREEVLNLQKIMPII